MKARILTGDKLVDEMMSRFDFAYKAALPHFERMERIQNAYDNTVDTVNWPTQSEIGIPLTFVSVEEQLPFAMKYLFPKNRFITMIPSVKMDRETVKRVEDDLRYTLRTEMSIELACVPSIRDCYKFAVGYGLIDTEYITPPEVVTNNAIMKGKVVAQTPTLTLGQKKQVPVYRYISPIQVIPMPDGANVEGPNKASGHFVIDFKYEDEFKSMYDTKGMDGKPLIKGNVEEIIKEARSMNLDSRMVPSDIIATIAGLDLMKPNNADARMPVVIPIIRCYFDHQQVWIANGKHVIWETKDSYQSLRSDLIKWSAWPDGLRWFPMGVTEASERLAAGVNIWYNGLVDLAMYIMNPTRVVNTRLLENPRDIGRGPKQDIKVIGNARDAVQYLTLPDFPQQLFSMGDILSQMHSVANAQNAGVRQGVPGLVRGGSNALESLLSSSTGRQYLAAIIIQSGGLKPTIEKTLIKKQLIMDESGDRFVEPAYDPSSGELFYEEKTVTLDEIRNVFRVELSMPAAKLNSMAAFSEKLNFFDRAMQNKELFNMRALYEDLADDEEKIARVMLPEDVVNERQERMAEAQMRTAEAGAAPEGAAPPMTEGEQGAAGEVGPMAALLGGE